MMMMVVTDKLKVFHEPDNAFVVTLPSSSVTPAITFTVSNCPPLSKTLGASACMKNNASRESVKPHPLTNFSY